MGERLIKPYEISVWEDKLTQDGEKFEEKKLAVIGSNTMTGLNKAYDPVFNKKANGEKTLTFSLKYKYFDPYVGNEGVVNPFVALLTNERKVKLHYDGQWYEFIVKEHVETSDEYTWSYTCTDAFVLELSKNGYNITFDSELNNNQGTARELAKETIKNTDWKLGGVQVGKQLVAEPLYKGTIVSPFLALNTDTGLMETCDGEVYVFYSYIKNKNGQYLQFIKQAETYTIDDKNVITATNYRITQDVEVTDSVIKYHGNNLITLGTIESRYQANRLAYNQLTTYDPVMQRTVDRFAAGDREIYRYKDYTYTTSNVVMNYITNGENFNMLEDGTMQGWNPYVDFVSSDPEDDRVDKLELVTKPELGAGKTLADLFTLSEIEGFLKVKFKGALTEYKNAVFNSGIENNASSIESISKGQKFVFRWRAGQRDPNEADETKSDVDCLVPCENLRLLVAKYTQDTPNRWSYYYKHIDPENIIMQFSGTPQVLNNIIKGGKLEEGEEEGKYNYVIDTVIQTPSTKYVYINSDDNQEYVWNGLQGNFELKTADNYLPYYYLVAEAQKSIPNSSLKDVTEKFGIFIYNTEGQVTYYIQDIQLTRFIPDGADSTGQTPILLGNVPTAVSNQTDYYYLKPADGTAAEDVEMYASVDELIAEYGISETVVPLYNEGSEKNLSISVSKSNCFDILQTIAETFECWIDLVVQHDDKGYILYDEENNPEKYVYLKEYAGKDNWAGFKYGINLDTIERTINSDEVVTKLIVDQSQSDLVDEGFVSIGNAPSNTSGESYILNFDYYYNQNLLNREEAEADRLEFVSDVAQLNLSLQEKEKQRRDLEASLTALGSKRNVYTELIETARETKTDALGEFENLTGQSYEAYRDAQAQAIRYNNKFYVETLDVEIVPNKIYYTYNSETGVMTEVESPDAVALNTYYELLVDLAEEDTILAVVGDLYVSSAAINNYSGILTNIDQEYWAVRKQLRGSENYKVKIWVDRDDNDQRHVFVELNDYLAGFSFEIGGSTYESTVSKKYFDLEKDDTTITFTAPEGFTIEESTYEINDSKVATFKITCNETVAGVEDEIEELQEQKDELTKEFNTKYSRFIQEGTWSSTDYIDSELYYLDALQVSNTSAQPTVSYTINVVEVSELENLEWYLFDAGDKTYVEDTEFFGWANVNGILTPAREEVIVSEVEWHLEEPDKNVITVQNYKTRFEDFFQRISATVQTVQYNEATYAKISSLLDANGTINQDVLLESLNNISGKQYNLTSNGSVMINDDVILVQNLTNPANRVIINSEGIRVSSDGGNTWTTAIDGQGINIGAVYTGTLNTNEVIIGSDENPSFRWDKAGISAYKSGQDGIYDLQTYVRYDEYGLYGIKEGGSFKAQSLQDVLDKAHFAVTWDGFFIRNSYEDGGRVSITSDNDFQVIDGSNTERIKIGSLGIDQVTGDRIYGINIKDKNGNSVLSTDNDGDLTISGTIYANAGEIGGMSVDSDRLKMDYIVFRPGTGIYSIYPNHEENVNNPISAYPFWIKDTDGSAIFNNVTVRGSIKTSVFEYEEIQAVGGAFMFRPSSAIRSAEVDGNDLVITVDKSNIIKNGAWYKLSNYTGDSSDAGAYGLVHIYQVSKTNNEIRLLGGAAVLDVADINDIAGGSIIDMGYEENHASYDDGKENYGIGINSSDNYINLPQRSISLFETKVDHTQDPKVEYIYRAILGTLPDERINNLSVDANVYQYMRDTQGIYTDNMYIGDNNQYISFYTQGNNKKLDIVTNELVVGSSGYLQSGNYVRGNNPKFAQAGTKIDLTTGDIITQYFRLSQGLEPGVAAGAYVHGTIEALDGWIGSDSTNYWEIGNYTDYNLDETAKIVGHGSSFIQLGDDGTWRLATNRIHTGWHEDGDSWLHYPNYTDGTDDLYWDYGFHTPESRNDKFIYIRTASENTALSNLLYDIDDDFTTHYWDYKLWIDGEGNLYAPNIYKKNAQGAWVAVDAGGSVASADRLSSGAGATNQPVYFPTSGPNRGQPVAIDYTIGQSVPADALWVKSVTTTGSGNAVTSVAIDANGAVTATKGTTFLTEETDPTVPSWAKETNKPSYSYSEINGTVPSSALPSYVDDVLEYATVGDFPATGESGKIYIDTNANITYRWGGSTYVEVGSSLALGETSSTAYRGDRGKIAYDHATAKGNAFSSGLYKITTNSEGHVTAATAATLSDLGGADDLQAIEALSGTSGFLKKTAANTWELGSETDPVFVASAAYGISSSDISNWNSKGTGSVTSVQVQATSPVQSSTSTAQSTTLSTTISLADGYGDTKNPYSNKNARYVLAAPANAAGAPSFRALTNADVGLNNVSNYSQITKIGDSGDGKLRVWTGDPDGSGYTDVTVHITAYDQSTVAKAEALDLSAAVGSTSKPVYFKADGKPYVIDYTIESNVPSNAVFTDHTYALSGSSNTITLTPSAGTADTVTVSDHSTTTIYGVGASTTTASNVTVGSHATDYGVTSAGSGNLVFTMDSTDTHKLIITHTHNTPTLGSKVPTVSTSNVTVPIKNGSSTTVVTNGSHTLA